MFGHRTDGKIAKDVDPFFRVIPCIMKERNDSQVYFKQDISLKNLDDYINKKAEEGIKISYIHIMFAAMVKTLGEREKLNRFAINGRIYQRNGIYISLALKKSMTDDGQETTIKLKFDGTENIFEVKEKLDAIIEKNKDANEKNDTDKFANFLNLIPSKLILWVVKFLMFLDKHGMLPKAIIELSPFHTSAFLTNVGSLGIDSIYHHLYNFGTTSMFFSMGKKKKSYIYEDDEFKQEKCITIAFVGDERICDGFYYASSFKQLARYLKKPELLENNNQKNIEDNKEKIIEK